MVMVNRDRLAACLDIEACGRRREAAERSKREGRAEDLGPNGNATTPGFFRRAGE
jgi:hypothetical protein